MKSYVHLKDKAREWRRNGLSLPEICSRLSLGKGTIYSWISDIPLQRKPIRSKRCNVVASRVLSKKYATLREEAYQQGTQQYQELSEQPFFRDFLVLYLTEGSRKEKNSVSVVNSNPVLVKLAWFWLSCLSGRKLDFRLHYHKDQNPESLRSYWASLLGISGNSIKVARKSNSGGCLAVTGGP